MTHTVSPGPSRQQHGYDPAERHRCMPAKHPWAGSAAGTTPCFNSSEHEWAIGIRLVLLLKQDTFNNL